MARPEVTPITLEFPTPLGAHSTTLRTSDPFVRALAEGRALDWQHEVALERSAKQFVEKMGLTGRERVTGVIRVGATAQFFTTTGVDVRRLSNGEARTFIIDQLYAAARLWAAANPEEA